jgi:tetratricopeptide (TPR) repeat protein
MWFFVTYLPTTNILTLLNPFAYRFMYLPSIGFFILTAWGIDRLGRWSKARNPSSRAGEVFLIILVAVCLSVTIHLNRSFKNNFSACREMIRRYPESSRPYWLLGLLHFRQGEYGQAISNLEQYLERKPNLPFIPDPKQDYAVYHLMGRSYVDDPET